MTGKFSYASLTFAQRIALQKDPNLDLNIYIQKDTIIRKFRK